MQTEVIHHVTSTDGTRIGFVQSGDGPPLVLVHGTSAGHKRWAPVLAAFEERFTVYAMDRRGRGLSGDAEPYALEREYEDVAAVVDSIGGPVDLLGHSYGALCAMEAALLTSNVRRLVLYESPVPTSDDPLYPEGMRERLDRMLERGEREEVLLTFFREVVGLSDAEMDAARADPSWQERLTAAHTVTREFADADYVLDATRFGGMTAPTLLLSGGESPPIMKAATEAVHRALPNSRIVTMEGQAHIANLTAPALFSRLVMDVLAE